MNASADKTVISGNGPAGVTSVQIALPGLKVGIIEAENVGLRSVDARLAYEMDAACENLRRLHSLDTLRQWEPVRAVRKMFSDWGLDPSKYRPSSEALLRRVVKGGSLPRISNVVDLGNWGAIETGWPYGCYDRGKITGPIGIRHGKPGEQYAGIGRQVLRLEGRPVFSDGYAPFGSPISDSTRTMVTGSTNELLVIICAPENSCDLAVEESLSRLSERLALWCSARDIRKRIVNATSSRHANFSEIRSFAYASNNQTASMLDCDLQNRRGHVAWKVGAD